MSTPYDYGDARGQVTVWSALLNDPAVVAAGRVRRYPDVSDAEYQHPYRVRFGEPDDGTCHHRYDGGACGLAREHPRHRMWWAEIT